MDVVSWPGWYRDRHGSEAIVIVNDGLLLSVHIREVEFAGARFDDLEPVDGTADAASAWLEFGLLCACTLEWDVPVTIVTDGAEAGGVLHCELRLTEPDPVRQAPAGYLTVTLRDPHGIMAAGRAEDLFELALDDLHRKLPAGTYVKTCIACAWSDYHPIGTPSFGGLMCFRDAKQAYREVRSKGDLFRVIGHLTGYVQETSVCPEFERRVADAGYRGPFPSAPLRG